MWKVNLPCNKEALKNLKVALTYKNQSPKYELKAGELEQLEKIYQTYDDLKGVAHEDLKGAGVSNDTKIAVQSAYSEIQESGRLKELRSTLLLATEYCPCCGIQQADELDHHLPQSVFHLLSLYSRNLVPICHKCNNKKKAVVGYNPSKRFVHVYYDEIPSDVQFFCMKHTISNDILTFEFFIASLPEISAELRTQMEFQIERVDLNQRLKKEVNTFLSAFGVSLKTLFDATQNQEIIKKFLLDNASFFRIKFGLNDWRTVTLLTMASCNIFCAGAFIKVLGLDKIPHH